ncbi:MAG: hypothetical protein OXG17_01705 [Chloroflexi bacterium]|nr:hypothetical protein [Chloroflexota bacterium]
MTFDASTLDLAADPLGFALEALDDDTPLGTPERVAAARRAWAILDTASFPKASIDAARRLALGVRALVLGGQPVTRAVALEAIEAAACWLESTGPAEEPARADAQEARGVASRTASEHGDVPDARMLEAAAMDLLAAAHFRQQSRDAEAVARTDLEIAEAFAIYPTDDRAPLIERAVGHARRAAATLTPALDATAHARCQLLLSGLLLDHPKTDPRQFAHAALGLADVALKVVDAERAPWVAARGWRARARAQELSGSADGNDAYARAAELLSAAGLESESRRLRRLHLCA